MPKTSAAAQEIASIIHNQPLAEAICQSIKEALASPFARVPGAGTPLGVFENSLSSAARDIEAHPRGRLFKRLIEFGPRLPDEPELGQSTPDTTLSDEECGTCAEFIYSHMINRFKGEIAELLSFGPCVGVVTRLVEEGRLTPKTLLYFGDLVEERKSLKRPGEEQAWGGFGKGADGLLMEVGSASRKGTPHRCTILGAIETKSMRVSWRKIRDQLDRHFQRLRGGLRLDGAEWPAGDLDTSGGTARRGKGAGAGQAIRIGVRPATWRLSRAWKSIKNEQGREIVLPPPEPPPCQNVIVEVQPGFWNITLAWSQEAIEQAALEMTYWYMSQVGKSVYSARPLPAGWEYMTPEQAGHNAVKMMLYYFPLRPLTKRQEVIAVRLYNVYGFGYPLAKDADEMLWPQDFPHEQ